MVRRYDIALANPGALQLTHRVSSYLMGSATGQLGPDFRRWAGEGHMSGRLRSELTAYQLCMLDDSFVEAPHAHISRIARQATVPSPSWWSATVRIEQNFQAYEKSKISCPGRFEQLFDAWKLMGQFRQGRYLEGQALKVPARQFLRSVYRTGAQDTQRDWTVLRPLTDRPGQGMPEVRPSDMEALIKEYLLAIFVPGSVVEVQDTRGVSASELLSGVAHPSGQVALVAPRQFYQVVSRALVSKKFVSTERLARIKFMRVPVVLQRLSLPIADGQEVLSSVIAVPEGFPEVQDVKTLGSWRDLRHRLHSWTVQSVTGTGGLVLMGRQPLGSLAWSSASVFTNLGAKEAMVAPDRIVFSDIDLAGHRPDADPRITSDDQT